MEKRGGKGRKKAAKKTSTAPKSYEKTIMLLIENNVGLQKKLLGLTESIDGMTKKVGRLLSLIEKASEGFVGPESGEGIGEKPGLKSSKTSRDELVDKLEGLIKQNKTIARGLILLEKYVREKTRGAKAEEEERREEFKPLPEYKF